MPNGTPNAAEVIMGSYVEWVPIQSRLYAFWGA